MSEATTLKKPRKTRSRKRLDNIRKMIHETKFHRHISHNIYQYEQYVKSGGAKLYSESELAEIKRVSVSDRLPPRATEYYMELARNSEAVKNLIKARPEEMEDLAGERDPSNQLKYSPVSGMLHKYELILLYVVRACSSWCRYCYRSDFLTSKTEKEIANVDEVVAYVKAHNERVATLTDADVSTPEEKFPIREALLSGGDPMVLSNRNLFEYINGLAEGGVRTIRIGTKELAFFPHRFDDNFFAMLDFVHELHPDLNLAFMVHFTHPDELLLRDPETKQYIRKESGHFKKIPVVEEAIRRLRDRSYVTLENQTPIIYRVNDDAEALRRLQIELKRMGVNNHYYFQCREIEGHRAFAVPVEEAWKIHKDSQKGLSGIEKSRFAMSTEAGKLEVISVIDKPDFAKMGINLPRSVKPLVDAIFGEHGLAVFKLHRTPYVACQGDLVIARRNPKALWISGYEDRILYDGRRARGEQYAPLAAIVKELLTGEHVPLEALHGILGDEEVVRAVKDEIAA
jgi:lysine 2,3-aminomutase